MDGSKTAKIGALVAVAALVFVGWTFGRFLLLDMRVAETMTQFPRYPEVSHIVGVKDQILEHAKKVKISPADLEVDVSLEQRNMGGGGGPSIGAGMAVGDSRAERWWFVVVRVYKKGRSGKPIENMKRIENSVADTHAEQLEKAGIKIRKL